MKKYIVPISKCDMFEGCMLMYTTSDNYGQGIQSAPQQQDKPQAGVTPTF